jgi:hypothetical protein
MGPVPPPVRRFVFTFEDGSQHEYSIRGILPHAVKLLRADGFDPQECVDVTCDGESHLEWLQRGLDAEAEEYTAWHNKVFEDLIAKQEKEDEDRKQAEEKLATAAACNRIF